MPAPPAEPSPAQRIAAAARRLRDAWGRPDLDAAEIHEAALALMHTTRTTDLSAALGVLHDVEAGYGHRSR